MGGLTATDLAYLQQPHLNGVPTGAVAAFDLPNGCPEGWSAFKDAQSRAIIGADFGQGFAPGLGANGDGSALRTWKYRDHGGGAAAEGGTARPAARRWFWGHAACFPTSRWRRHGGGGGGRMAAAAASGGGGGGGEWRAAASDGGIGGGGTAGGGWQRWRQ